MIHAPVDNLVLQLIDWHLLQLPLAAMFYAAITNINIEAYFLHCYCVVF